MVYRRSVVILRDPEKFTTKQDGSTFNTSSWESTRDRHSVLANGTVPPDCIERVTSQHGEVTIYQPSTPRPAPRAVLKNVWHEQQQQQQQQVVLRSRGKLLAGHCPKGVHSTVQKEPRETACGTLSEAPSLNNAAKEDSSFQVDVRFHGVSQDDIYKDEERMTEMQNVVDRLQDGYRNKSIIEDWKQEGVSDTVRLETNSNDFGVFWN